MDASLLYQDNMSAILLETNGKVSSSKRTKHIKVQYFYVKDKINQGKIVVEHCPTWVFRGHVMSILMDYKDNNFRDSFHFRPPNWIPDSVSVLMLPIPKDWVA
jgi:hypothetical protein